MIDDVAESVQRIDRWLWYARLTKSRTLAQALVARGKVRVNRIKIDKPSTLVKPGDVLTVSLGPNVRSFEILGIAARRGPAPEAQVLYRDLAPPEPGADSGVKPLNAAARALPQALRDDGAGRPTKRERRLTDKLKGR